MINDIELLRIAVGEVLTPDLLRKDWRVRTEGEHHTYGHCYVAAEALFHLIGGYESSFVPRYAKYFDDSDDCWCTHWWLYSASLNMIYDPTKEQYTYCNVLPPYHNKSTSGFLTKWASKRAVIVMDRVKHRLGEDMIESVSLHMKKPDLIIDGLFDGA